MKITFAALAALTLFAASCTDKKGATTGTATGSNTNSASTTGSGHYAYIDIDTFQAHYTVLMDKKKEFSTQEDAMQSELQRSAQQLQASVNDFQKKAQDGKMSQTEGEATKRKLEQMQQSLETRKQSMEADFLKKQDVFNTQLHNDLDSFLGKLSDQRHYDFVFSYSKANPSIMYANKGLDITQEVIKGMNEAASSRKK